MHLELVSIKMDNIVKAERNLELLKILLENEQAVTAFVEADDFYKDGMNGLQI
jgi:hypothetical protein